jgi:DNA adenine methylase
LRAYKDNVVVHEIDHTYSFGNQNHKTGNKSNRVKEYLFIGR